MDKDFKFLFAASNLLPGEARTTETTLRVKRDGSGEVEVVLPDGPRPYTLKPLTDLYGAGAGAGSVDPKDERFMPLMMSIEEEIARAYGEAPSLTDGAVSLALGSLAMSPESPQSEPLAKRVQAALRLTLSRNDYSRQEVRQALRHVIRSVERHSRADGRRGYLEFIRGFFSGGGVGGGGGRRGRG